MTVIADLTPDEQRLLISSLDAAAIIVSAASPGRKEETASEGFAVAEFVLSSQAAYVANPLVSSTILEVKRRVDAEVPFPDYVALASAPGAYDRAIAILREAVALLDTKSTPDEAAGYKAWLQGIAQAAAEAGKERTRASWAAEASWSTTLSGPRWRRSRRSWPRNAGSHPIVRASQRSLTSPGTVASVRTLMNPQFWFYG